MKNNFGLVWGTFKTELHKRNFETDDFARVIVDICQDVRPTLNIIDGILALEGDGPGTGGKARHKGLIIAGGDAVAVDAVLSRIMGLQPEDIPTIKEARTRNFGVADLNSISILGEKLEDVFDRPFLLPATSITRKLPKPVVKLAQKLIRYYPCVEADHCVKCAACIKACPMQTIGMGEKCVTFDYSKCIACFCCQEVCPESAIKIKKSWFARLIGF